MERAKQRRLYQDSGTAKKYLAIRLRINTNQKANVTRSGAPRERKI